MGMSRVSGCVSAWSSDARTEYILDTKHETMQWSALVCGSCVQSCCFLSHTLLVQDLPRVDRCVSFVISAQVVFSYLRNCELPITNELESRRSSQKVGCDPRRHCGSM